MLESCCHVVETERDQLYEETCWRSSKKSRRISNDSKLSYTSECQIIHLGVLVESLSEHSLHICQVVRQIQRDYSMLRSGNSSWVLWSRPQENMFKARKRKQGPTFETTLQVQQNRHNICEVGKIPVRQSM